MLVKDVYQFVMQSSRQIAFYHLDFWQLAFLRITFYHSAFSLVSLLAANLTFIQPSVIQPTIWLVFCQLACHHLAFVTVSHVYSQTSVQLAFYALSFLFNQPSKCLIASTKFRIFDQKVPNLQSQFLALTDPKP